MKIWCVEDDIDIRDIEMYTLAQSGFEADGFSDGASMWTAMEKELPALIVLDQMLPGDSGVDILKQLKSTEKTKRIPVIMATAKGMEYCKVQSLDLGADDYLVKPFGMMELVSRVRAVLRRTQPDPTVSHVYRIGDLVLNPDEYTVKMGGKQLILTLKEYEILKLLISHLGTAFTREKLLEEVWGYDFIGASRTIDVHIRTLRRKLGKYGEKIKTIRGVGYRMEA